MVAATTNALKDRLLVMRMRAGSTGALASIYEKHRHALLRVASGLLGETALAEDVVQDVFLQIVRSPDKIRRNGSLRAYLCICVANRARNRGREARRRAGESGIDPDQLPAGDIDGARWMIHNDRLEALNRALAKLPEEQREAVVLHLQGEMSFRQIAEAAGVSANTIQSRCRYGIDRLRSHLKGEF